MVISNYSQEVPPKAKGTKMLMILEAMQMQFYDAMRDLRDKIRVLQMPLFKVILAGEVKVKSSSRRGRMGLNNNKETNFGP